MEKVVVTGATGFIGKRLVKSLFANGFEVIPWTGETGLVGIDRVYHLAAPSSNTFIHNEPIYVMDTIMDVTRAALKICPTAMFINASSMGALEITDDQQGAYNVAKRCMEVYIKHSGANYVNYRIPSVYGEEMHQDGYIARCINKTAYMPPHPDKEHYIAHVDEVVDALVELRPINIETITLGQIYELFNSGRRGLYRPTPNKGTV